MKPKRVSHTVEIFSYEDLMSSLRRPTLMQSSEGRAEIMDSKGNLSPRSGKTLRLPALTAEAARAILSNAEPPLHKQQDSGIRIKVPDGTFSVEFEKRATTDKIPDAISDSDLLPTKTIEALLAKTRKEIPRNAFEPEETIAPARPAMFDVPQYRDSEPAQLELAPYDPSQTTYDIQNQRTRIGNKVRVAVAVGVGVALGLAGTALYREYHNEQNQEPHATNPIPEKNGL